MCCHSCGRTNDPLNVIMNFPNPKTGHKWHVTFRRRYAWSEVNLAEAWNGGTKKIAMCSNVATNLSKQTYDQIIQASTVSHFKTIATHPNKGASGIYLMRQPSLYTSKAPTLRAIWPNVADIMSEESAQLDILFLPKEATIARVFNNATSTNLVYIGNVCDAVCTETLAETDVKIFNR